MYTISPSLVDTKNKYDWRCEIVPSTVSTTRRPLQLSPARKEQHAALLSTFHRSIFAAQELWEDVEPIPPWSPTHALSALALIGVNYATYVFAQLPELVDYAVVPGIHGRGHSLYGDPDVWDPSVPWGEYLPSETLRRALPFKRVTNHCAHYGLHMPSFLSHLRQEAQQGMKLPLHITGAPLYLRVYLAGSAVRILPSDLAEVRPLYLNLREEVPVLTDSSQYRLYQAFKQSGVDPFERLHEYFQRQG